MPVQIDPAAGTVTLDGQAWPLELNCRDGSALVRADRTVHRLRPLRWHEKQVLARFARHGPALVAQQRLALALDGAPVPRTPSLLEVLAAVAAWLDDPDALPLERAVLARVTVDLCRDAGLRPNDLDDRDAAEVETWWRATLGPERRDEAVPAGLPAMRPHRAVPRSAQTRAADPWADATSIRFIEAPAAPHPEPGHATGRSQPIPPSGGTVAGVAASPAAGGADPEVRADAQAPTSPGHPRRERGGRPAAARRLTDVRFGPAPAPLAPVAQPRTPRAPAPSAPATSGTTDTGPRRLERPPELDRSAIPPPTGTEVPGPDAAVPGFDRGSGPGPVAWYRPSAPGCGDPVDVVLEALLERLEEAAGDVGIEL